MQDSSKKQLKIFSAAAFLNDFGSDMIYSVWPVFLTQVLHIPLAALGFLDGIGDAVVSLSQGVAGYLSDRFQTRKIFIWLGYVFGGLSRLGYALARSWPLLVPLRILDRAGKIRGAPRDAMIAEASSDRTRGRNFGVLRAFDNLGAVCGIVASYFLIRRFGFEPVFLIAALPSFIGALLIALFIREARAPQGYLFKGWSLKNFGRDFYLYLAGSAVFSLGAFSYSFLILYATNFGFAAVTVPLLYLLFTVTASVFSLPFGTLADRIGRKPVLYLSYALWAATSLSLIARPGTLLLVISFFIYGLHRAAIEPVQKAFVAELIPSEMKASGLGGFQMVIGLCALPASVGAGLLWEKVNLFAPLYFTLALTVIAAGILLFVRESKKGNKIFRVDSRNPI